MSATKNINDLGSAEKIASKPIGAVRLTSGSLLARNATLNLTTEGWIFLVLLVAMPKLVLFLGDTQFGLFSLAWVVIGYLAFLDVGVNRAATKFVSEHLAEQDHESTRLIVRTALLRSKLRLFSKFWRWVHWR